MSILYPVFLQVLLTFAVLIAMGPARSQSLRDSRTPLTDRDLALGQNTWSDTATKRANNFRNQFELPVLFYAVVAFALLLKQTDALMVGLAWAFALSRVAHAAIHVGFNDVWWRAVVYLGGAVALLAMWIVLGVRVASGAV